MIAMIVLILGALFIANNQQIDFKNVSSTFVFTKIYGKWVWQVGANIKDLVVIAYNMKWMPQMENVPSYLGITVLNTSLNISI